MPRLIWILRMAVEAAAKASSHKARCLNIIDFISKGLEVLIDFACERLDAGYRAFMSIRSCTSCLFSSLATLRIKSIALLFHDASAALILSHFSISAVRESRNMMASSICRRRPATWSRCCHDCFTKALSSDVGRLLFDEELTTECNVQKTVAREFVIPTCNGGSGGSELCLEVRDDNI